MSRYKVNFFVNSNANFRSTNAEVIDLVDDYGYTEKEAEEIIKDENEQHKLFEEWRDDNIDQNFGVVKEN